MNNDVNNTNGYIDSKTGSGYVSAGNNKMDGSVLLVIIIGIVLVLGGGIFVVSNSKELWEDFKDKMIEVSGDLEDIEEEYEDEYIDLDDFEEDDYIKDDDSYYDEQDYYNENDYLTYNTESFKEINARNIYNESKGKAIVVWIGRQSCGYCGMYAPVMEDVTRDFGIVARYVDLEKIINFNTLEPYVVDDIAFTILNNLSGKGKWSTFAKDNIGGTPLTLIIKDYQVIGGVSGYVDEYGLTEVFLDAGLQK